MAAAVKVITCTADELRTLIRSAVRDELARRDLTPPTDDSGLLPTREAATYCRMEVSRLLKHIAQGRLVPDSPARKGFRVHRFRRSTLDAFLLGL